jgi:predicted ArsR family transcriptional regulator
MPTRPTTRDRIAKLLRDTGDMTAKEIAAELGMLERTISSCINTARNTKEKHFYVVDYERKVGEKGMWAKVYRCGSRKDAPRPIKDRRVYDARYQERHGAAVRLARRDGFDMSNPFAVAMTQVLGANP